MKNKFNSPASAEFLEELRERARRYGWRGDYDEIARFVEDLHRDAGIFSFPEGYYEVIEEE